MCFFVSRWMQFAIIDVTTVCGDGCIWCQHVKCVFKFIFSNLISWDLHQEQLREQTILCGHRLFRCSFHQVTYRTKNALQCAHHSTCDTKNWFFTHLLCIEAELIYLLHIIKLTRKYRPIASLLFVNDSNVRSSNWEKMKLNRISLDSVRLEVVKSNSLIDRNMVNKIHVFNKSRLPTQIPFYTFILLVITTFIMHLCDKCVTAWPENQPKTGKT